MKKENKMKKILLVSIGLVFVLAACGGGGGSSSGSSQSSSISDDSSSVPLNDNSKVALKMPTLNNDSSTPLDEINK